MPCLPDSLPDADSRFGRSFSLARRENSLHFCLPAACLSRFVTRRFPTRIESCLPSFSISFSPSHSFLLPSSLFQPPSLSVSHINSLLIPFAKHSGEERKEEEREEEDSLLSSLLISLLSSFPISQQQERHTLAD